MEFNAELVVWCITSAILAIMHFALSLSAIRARKESGDYYALPKKKNQLAAIRAHGNFCEMVPFSLILLFALSVLDSALFLQILLSLLLIVSRVLHAYSMLCRELSENPSFKLRRYGMAMNLFLNIAAAIYILELIVKLIV